MHSSSINNYFKINTDILSVVYELERFNESILTTLKELNQMENFIKLINSRNNICYHINKPFKNQVNMNPPQRFDKSTNIKYIGISDMFKQKKRKAHEKNSYIEVVEDYSSEIVICLENIYLWESKYSYIFPDLYLFEDITCQKYSLDNNDNKELSLNNVKPTHYLVVGPVGCGITSLIKYYAKQHSINLRISDKFSINQDIDIHKIIPRSNQATICNTSFIKKKSDTTDTELSSYISTSIFFDDIDFDSYDDTLYSAINKFLQQSPTTVFIRSECISVVNRFNISNLNIINLYENTYYPDEKEILNFLKLIMFSEGYIFSYDLLEYLYGYFNKNIKKLFNYLQFWFDRNLHYCYYPNELNTISDLKPRSSEQILYSIKSWQITFNSNNILNLNQYVLLNEICSNIEEYDILDNDRVYLFYLTYRKTKYIYSFLKYSNPLLFFKRKYSLKVSSQSFKDIAVQSHCRWDSLCLDYYPYISNINKNDQSSISTLRNKKKYSYLQRRSLNLRKDEMNFIEKYF